MFSGTSKSPKLEQLETLLRNSMFVRPVAPVVNFNYRSYDIVDKMFDQKLRAIISYLSITDVGSTEYH